MNKDIVKIDVIFRKYKDNGAILAVFPYDMATHKGDVTCYEHHGQHGAGDYNACISMTVPATPSEYDNLKRELESIGYELTIVKRCNYNKYLNERAMLTA